MRSEIEYDRFCEAAALGESIAANAKAIFDSCEVETMAALQRNAYKHTDAGISVSFELHDGTFVWVGDERAREIAEPWNHIRSIGVSSIVEGSDAEVPLTWIDLANDRFMDEGGEAIAVAEFNRLCDDVDIEACALWDEANREE